MSKSVANAMDYELTGSKKAKGKNVAISMAEQVATHRLLWIVLKRHRVGLLAAGNVVLVLNWAIPAWPEIIKSLF